ncbi:hypothetical protein [Hyphomicrobium sp.]|uniref:hypothetical protein n=1 Tax=Hyphomicrobium sp. TaxID=82 RepID=UPI003F6F781D
MDQAIRTTLRRHSAAGWGSALVHAARKSWPRGANSGARLTVTIIEALELETDNNRKQISNSA